MRIEPQRLEPKVIQKHVIDRRNAEQRRRDEQEEEQRRITALQQAQKQQQQQDKQQTISAIQNKLEYAAEKIKKYRKGRSKNTALKKGYYRYREAYRQALADAKAGKNIDLRALEEYANAAKRQEAREERSYIRAQETAQRKATEDLREKTKVVGRVYRDSKGNLQDDQGNKIIKKNGKYQYQDPIKGLQKQSIPQLKRIYSKSTGATKDLARQVLNQKKGIAKNTIDEVRVSTKSGITTGRSTPNSRKAEQVFKDKILPRLQRGEKISKLQVKAFGIPGGYQKWAYDTAKELRGNVKRQAKAAELQELNKQKVSLFGNPEIDFKKDKSGNIILSNNMIKYTPQLKNNLKAVGLVNQGTSTANIPKIKIDIKDKKTIPINDIRLAVGVQPHNLDYPNVDRMQAMQFGNYLRYVSSKGNQLGIKPEDLNKVKNLNAFDKLIGEKVYNFNLDYAMYLGVDKDLIKSLDKSSRNNYAKNNQLLKYIEKQEKNNAKLQGAKKLADGTWGVEYGGKTYKVTNLSGSKANEIKQTLNKLGYNSDDIRSYLDGTNVSRSLSSRPDSIASNKIRELFFNDRNVQSSGKDVQPSLNPNMLVKFLDNKDYQDKVYREIPIYKKVPKAFVKGVWTDLAKPFLKGAGKVTTRPVTESVNLGKNLTKLVQAYGKSNNPNKTQILSDSFKEAFSKSEQKKIVKEVVDKQILSDKDTKTFLSLVAIGYGAAKAIPLAQKGLTAAFGAKLAPKIITAAMATPTGFSVVKATRDPSAENDAQLAVDIAFLGAGVAAKGARLAKAKFSPTVIKNVKILEGSASERGTGAALQALEGKEIDLYHTTTAKLKDIFRSAPINKKDLDILVKDMINNPDLYLTANKKIKPLKTIATDKPKGTMVEFLKGRKDVVLSGSASLKLQTKNFRKVGDFDIVAKNPRVFAQKLAAHLNNNTLLGKMVKNRYQVFKGVNTWQIRDTLNSGFKILQARDAKLVKQYKAASLKQKKQIMKRRNALKNQMKKYDIADVADWKTQEKNWGKLKIRKVDGVQILDSEYQLKVKSQLSADPMFDQRKDKEIKDIALMIGKAIKGKKFKKAREYLEKSENYLKVEGRLSGTGTSRRYGWAKKYLGELNLPFKTDKKLEGRIRSRLKKLGFTDKMIDDNIKLYTPTDLYFSPNQIYSYYLRGGKGAIIMIKNQKISSYPKNIQDMLKKNFAGQLSAKEQGELKMLMREYRLKNPDKVFVGQEALSERFGEFEVLAPEFTKIYPKKTFLKREVYIPSLDKFIRVQEAVIGKRPQSVLSKLYKDFKVKLKKGYTVKQMRKDITSWAKKNIKNFGTKTKTKIKSVATKKGRAATRKKKTAEKKQLEKEREFLASEKKKYEKMLKEVDKSKKTAKEKAQLKKRLREKIRKVTPRSLKTIGRVKMRARTSKDIRTVKRILSRKPTRPGKPRTPTRPRAPSRTPTRPRKPTRPGKPRTPTRPRAPSRTPTRPRITPRVPPTGGKTTPPPKKPIRFPKPDIERTKPLKKGNYAYDLQFRERRDPNKPYNKKTNPIVVKTRKLGLPINAALKKGLGLIDRTTQRSAKLVMSGTTQKKDTVPAPSLMKKFRIRKTKEALLLVEKSKHTIDTSGEKKGLAISSKKKIKTKPKKKYVNKVRRAKQAKKKTKTKTTKKTTPKKKPTTKKKVKAPKPKKTKKVSKKVPKKVSKGKTSAKRTKKNKR